jgi:hypothetical protein
LPTLTFLEMDFSVDCADKIETASAEYYSVQGGTFRLSR